MQLIQLWLLKFDTFQLIFQQSSKSNMRYSSNTGSLRVNLLKAKGIGYQQTILYFPQISRAQLCVLLAFFLRDFWVFFFFLAWYAYLSQGAASTDWLFLFKYSDIGCRTVCPCYTENRGCNIFSINNSKILISSCIQTRLAFSVGRSFGKLSEAITTKNNNFAFICPNNYAPPVFCQFLISCCQVQKIVTPA